MFSNFFHIVFFQPLYNGLVFLVNIMPFNDLGLAIVSLTVLVRFALFPLSHKSTVTQKKIKTIEPEIKKIKEKFKDNREEQTRKVLELYKNHGISPFSGFFMLLIQLPVFIALFMILKEVPNLRPEILYSFLSIPSEIGTIFLGLFDVSKASYFLSFSAAVSQFFQIKLAMPEIKNNKHQKKDHSFKSELQKSMNIQMRYFMPIFIFFVALRFSSGLALYWTTSNIFAIFHEIVVSRKAKKIE